MMAHPLWMPTLHPPVKIPEIALRIEHVAQARLAVPTLVRSRARILKLNKFDASTIEECEKQQTVGAGDSAACGS
jgi:hypothetical protein